MDGIAGFFLRTYICEKSCIRSLFCIIFQFFTARIIMENPELTRPNGEPVAMPGEFFVLSRSGISFSAKSSGCVCPPSE